MEFIENHRDPVSDVPGSGRTGHELLCQSVSGAKVDSIKRYSASDVEGKSPAAGPPGSVQLAKFTLAGQSILCIDSPVEHNFTFTPATSLYVDCLTDEEFTQLFAQLAEGGTVMMPIDDYGFSRKFAWVGDRFGVSWQLNLPRID